MRASPITFTKAGARKIVRATRQAERAPKSKVKRATPARGLQPTKYARVTATITAANGTTLGAGSVSLQTVTVTAGGTASYADLGTTTPCFSGASASIAVGRLVIVAVVDGFYHVIVDFC